MALKTGVVYGISVVMLSGSWLIGHEVQRTSSVADIDFATLPTELGPWRCTEASDPYNKQDGETAYYRMNWRKDAGQEVAVTLSVTRTRLGSLRDWSLARMGQGWALGEEITWQSPSAEGLPFPILAGARWIGTDRFRQVCINWYVSPKSQSPTFLKAEMLGWRDRLLGREDPWGQMYVASLSQGESQELWQATQDVALRLAPHFYKLLNSAVRS